MDKNKRYTVIKSLDYSFIDRKTDEKISFKKDYGRWRYGLNEMSGYIRKKKIKSNEIDFAPSLSRNEKAILLEKICKYR